MPGSQKPSDAGPEAPAADPGASRQSLFHKLFAGMSVGGTAETDPKKAVDASAAEQPSGFRQAFGNVANSWRAVLSAATGDGSTASASDTHVGEPWTRIGSPFVRIALCGEEGSGRSSLARHAEGRLRKMSQRAAPFIEQRVPATERPGGSSYTYEVLLQTVHRQRYATLVTISDTGPSVIDTPGTCLRDIQQADAIVLVYPLTGIKQRQRYTQPDGADAARKSAGVSPDSVLLSPQSEALLVRLLSAVLASRYDSGVRVFLVATFMDCLSDTSIPATRAVLVQLRRRAAKLFPQLDLAHLFAVSFKDQSCVSEAPLHKPDDVLEIGDMWSAMFRTVCSTTHNELPSTRTATATATTRTGGTTTPLAGPSATEPATVLVWRPVPYSVVLKRLEEDWCTVDSTASLKAEPQPLVYLRELEANMNVSSQRALLFIEQSQARQDVVFLSVDSLWKRFFALGVTSRTQFLQLLRYLEGRGQIAVFANRTLRRGQLRRGQPVSGALSRRAPLAGGADRGSSQLSDCVCMHPRLMRHAEAVIFWYHRLATKHEKHLESALYGVDTKACRDADVDNEVAKGFFSPALLRLLSEYLVLPEHFDASPTQRLQIFVSLLCLTDVGCVVRGPPVTESESATQRSHTAPSLTGASSLAEGTTGSRSTFASVYCAPEGRGARIVEVEDLMPALTPRGQRPASVAEEVDSCVTPFVRVSSSLARDLNETVSNVASEASSAANASGNPFEPSGKKSKNAPQPRAKRWRLLVPSLLGSFPCPTHLLQTAAALCSSLSTSPCHVGNGSNVSPSSLIGSALVYKISPMPPPSFFATLTSRFAPWCVPPLFSDSLWLWPRKPTLRGAVATDKMAQPPQVRLCVALVSPAANAGGVADPEVGAHLELYCFAAEGAQLALALTQKEAVIEIESVLQQKYPELRASRDNETWLCPQDQANEDVDHCTCIADLDVLFSCSE